MTYRLLVFCIAIIAYAFSLTQVVFAHGDEPRLEISVESVNPGSVVDVRGVYFEPEELITLALLGDGFEFSLGEIIADEEGTFLQIIVLPSDLAEGLYRFRAITDDHEILSPILTVIGVAISNGEGDEPVRDEDEPLLAPMPTYAPGVVPGGFSQEIVQTIPQKLPLSKANAVLFVVFFLVLVVLAAFRLWTKSRK